MLTVRSPEGERLAAVADRPCYLNLASDGKIWVSLTRRPASALLVLPDARKPDHRVIVPRLAGGPSALTVEGVPVLLPLRVAAGQLIRFGSRALRLQTELVVSGPRPDSSPRCAYCHWRIAGTAWVPCPACGGAHHTDCWFSFKGGKCSIQRCRAAHPGPMVNEEELTSLVEGE